MGLFKTIITARPFCTSFQSALPSISQPLGFRLVLYELDTQKNPQTHEKLSARTPLRKIFAKPPPLPGPSYKSPPLPHPFKEGKSPSQLLGSHLTPRVSSHLKTGSRSSRPVWQDGMERDGMGGMRNLEGCRAEPRTPVCFWLKPGELSSCCWKTE